MKRLVLIGTVFMLVVSASVLHSRRQAAPAVAVSGELRQWHKVTLTLDGPQTDEAAVPNPFTDLRMTVTFTHESGSPSHEVPGYFATDGNAANTSATAGNKWRAHLSPDKTGKWNWKIGFVSGPGIALNTVAGQAVTPFNGATGSVDIVASNKAAPDFRALGRLRYVGKHHLQFAGNGQYFIKAGPDSPESLLGYADFDGTVAMKPAVPLKTYNVHSQDWKTGNPTWKDGKGKGLIGALNYLSSKKMNSISFLPYNAGGDGDNVWPFVDRNDKLRYDVSKLDQWQIVFDHAQAKGIFLHFKMQETENDDGVIGQAPGAGVGGGPVAGGRGGAAPTAPAPAPAAAAGAPGAGVAGSRGAAPAGQGPGGGGGGGRGGRGGDAGGVCSVPVSLDCGNTGTERRLYVRELVARFGYELGLNWNMGEENTQTPVQQRAFAQAIRDYDPYDHLLVVHTFPGSQEQVYQPLLGQPNVLTGVSLQNSWQIAHRWTTRWVRASAAAGTPWVVAHDEQAPAGLGVPPDPGYQGFKGLDAQGNTIHTLHDVRRYTLWGNLMGGGAGVEYYFGYGLPHNDLVGEDFRSRDKSWDYAAVALDFMKAHKIPFWEMSNADMLVGNSANENTRYCLAKAGEVYVVYLPIGGSADLDLAGVSGTLSVNWFDPRNGGALKRGSVASVTGGRSVALGMPPDNPAEDWVVVVRRN